MVAEKNGYAPRNDGILDITKKIPGPYHLRVANSTVSDSKNNVIWSRVPAFGSNILVRKPPRRINR